MNKKAKQLGKMNSFPFVVEYDDGQDAHFGMSMREYFAGLAMQALSARIEIYEKWAGHTGRYEKHLAEHAVRCADALLEELSK